MILPALTEATSPLFRPIKYSLFPPLGLATLAAYLPPDVDVSLLSKTFGQQTRRQVMALADSGREDQDGYHGRRSYRG
jgi:hypothetical protein